MSHCLPPNTLRQVLDGGLPATALEEVQSHVDRCPRCLAMLAQLSEDVELRSWVRTGSLAREEPGLDRLMREILDTRRTLATHDGSFLQQQSPATRPAADTAEFPGYLVQRELGRGGMGIVLQALETALQRSVALKLLRSDRNAEAGCRERFLQEARAAARVKHDNVVDIYGVVVPEQGAPYLVMEFVAGPTLRERIEDSGPLAPRAACEICAQVAEGLAAAHAAGLIHRDIKPSNILFDRVSGRAKIMDFGLARAVDGTGLTLAGELLGTPAYMSPEQIRQPDAIDARSDVYSLGATFYEALTGVEPFRGTTHGVLQQVLHDEPRSPRLLNEAVPGDLETICLRALAKEPARRYAGALAMGEDLRRWLRGEPILARPVSAGERLWRWSRRNPRVATLSGLVALLLLLVSVGSLLFASRLAREHSETIAALGQAEANATAARAAEAQAVLNAEEARDLGEAALEAHSALVFKVQEQLGNKPGTLALRKQLLETALAGFEKIVKRPHTPDSEHSVLAAYDRMADVLTALGRSDEALRSGTAACNLAEQRAARMPEDIQAQRDLAQAHDKLGTMRYIDHNLSTAMVHYEKSRAIRAALAEKNSKPEFTRELAVSLNKLADVFFYTNQHAKAEECYLQALKLTHGVAEADARNTTYKRDLRFSYGRLATVYEGRRDFEQAAAFQKLAGQRAQELAGLDPANTQWQRDFGFTAGQAGTLDLKLDQLGSALEHFGTYLKVAEKLHAADPDNAQWARDVGLACQHLAETQLRQGKQTEARASMVRARAAVEQLMKHDPTNVALRVDLVLICLRLADLEERQGHYREAARETHRVTRLLRDLDQEGKLQGPFMGQLKELTDVLHTAFSQVAELSGFENKPLAPDANPGLLALWSLARARRGSHAEAAAGAERLCERAVENAGAWAVAARIYALCAALTPSASSLRDRYIDKSVRALSETLRLSPTYEWHLEPDFDPIRATQGYRRLFDRKD